MAANIQGNNKSERLLPPPKHVKHHTVRRVCDCEVQGDRFDKGHESSGATAVSVFLTTTQIFGVPGDYFLEGLDYFEADADVEWVGNASELGSVSTRIVSSLRLDSVERMEEDNRTRQMDRPESSVHPESLSPPLDLGSCLCSGEFKLFFNVVSIRDSW